MKIRSLDELTGVEETVRRFGPYGFNTAGMMTPEDTVTYQQELVAAADLPDRIPEELRLSFDRLRELHTYGAFCYDLYTVVDDQSILLFEQALAERFVSLYDGHIKVARDGEVDVLRADHYGDVAAALGAGGTHEARRGWRLLLRHDVEHHFAPSGLASLFRWARRERLLHGQRNRLREDATRRIRNRVAHSQGYHLAMPVDSARAVWDAYEFICRLWDVSIENSRLYPKVERRPIVLAWAPDESEMTVFEAHHGDASLPGWQGVLLLANADCELWSYDTHFEMTGLPVEFIDGPLDLATARKRLSTGELEGDVIDPLDRLFLVQNLGGRIAPPRSIEVALSLTADELKGTWHAVRADSPGDAIGHVRRRVGDPTWSTDGPACTEHAGCPACPVTTVAVGPWSQIEQTLTELGELPRASVQPRRFRMPALRAT